MPPKASRPPKKSGKGKERKQRRKQEQAELAESLAKINAAYEVKDYMSALPAFRRFNRNGLELTLAFHKAPSLPEADLQWAFELMKSSVKTYYESSGWGWNDRNKWQELTHEKSCFIVARDDTSGSPCGFTSFRFDMDNNLEVLYCYEIHLSAEVRRKGLGRLLMQILELIGHRAGMRKVVLTVFKENTISNAFFRQKMNFVEDDTSPLLCDPLNEEDYGYSIFSKLLVKPAKPAGPAQPVVPAEGCREAAQQVSVGTSGRGERFASPEQSPYHDKT